MNSDQIPDAEPDISIHEKKPAQQLPHNIEAEQALIGAILVNNTCLEIVNGYLKPEHFFEPVHQRIYNACQALNDKGGVADPVRLKPYFDGDEALKEIGGATYLARLAASATTIINANDYAKTIYSLWQGRSIILASECAIAECMDMDIDAPIGETLTRLENDLGRLSGQETGLHTKTFSDAITTALNEINEAHRDSGVVGITTGLQDLDNMLGGLISGKLYIAAGRPGMGKSILATSMCLAAAKSGKNVLFMSPEMLTKEIAARFMSNLNEERIEYQSMERGKVKNTLLNGLTEKMNNLELPIFINDRGGVNLADVTHEVKRLNRYLGTKGQKIDLLIIDHIHRMQKTRGLSTYDGMSEIAEGLKTLAKDHNMPVFAMAQLNRGLENRDDKRPKLSDLKESGRIEEEADAVLFLYREAYYNAEAGVDAKELEIQIAKQRSGGTGTHKFYIDLGVAKIEDKARQHEGFDYE